LNENSSRHLGRTFDEDHNHMKPRNRNPDAPHAWLPWNVNRRSLSSETDPQKPKLHPTGRARTSPPTFLFLQMNLSKNTRVAPRLAKPGPDGP